MDKSVQITLIIVAGILIIGFLGFNTFSNLNPTNTVTTSGQSTVEVTPDLIGVYFNVETKSSTSEQATSDNAEIVEALQVELFKQDFSKDEIETISFNVYPNYNWNSGARTQNGYIATHQIRVKIPIEDSDKIGEVIDSGVSSGAGVSYINYELTTESQNQYKAEAIKLASQDARIKAEAMAEGLNKKLGKLVSVSDSNFNYYPGRLYEASGNSMDTAEIKQATTDINPSAQTVYANVNVVFRLR